VYSVQYPKFSLTNVNCRPKGRTLSKVIPADVLPPTRKGSAGKLSNAQGEPSTRGSVQSVVSFLLLPFAVDDMKLLGSSRPGLVNGQGGPASAELFA
jgi:hypothetical protein